MKKICSGLYSKFFYVIIPTLFLYFCHSAIPTSCYILNVFDYLFKICWVKMCSELFYAIIVVFMLLVDVLFLHLVTFLKVF